MWYATTLFLASAVMVIGMTVSFSLVDGQLPLFAFLLPLLFFTRAPQTSFWFILLAVTAYAMIVPHRLYLILLAFGCCFHISIFIH